MSKQMPNSLFIVSPFGTEQAGLYQDLLRGLSSYEQFGNRLIQLAEHAHAFRQFDRLKEIGEILSNFPIKSYQSIGYYYLAVSYNRCGNGDLEKAKGLFTLAADTAPPLFSARAILSLAAVSAHLKKLDAELYYFTETLKASKDIATSLIAYLGIAVHKSREGYHKQALADLENILPVIKYAPAHTYFDILNSYAVELGEVGRKDEARNIMRVVLASPLAVAYPMWRETAEELRGADRSTVTVSASHYNILTMPEREASEQRAFEPRPARVLDLAKWKKKMAKKAKDKQTEQFLEDMSLQDMGFKLLGLISDNRMDEDQMRIIL
ncbi:MAG TPA: hypothetical protein VJ464_25915, partial [Blastocatellia bacterium]|nr:hypothetical protein [Blastocatellia bacterium]